MVDREIGSVERSPQEPRAIELPRSRLAGALLAVVGVGLTSVAIAFLVIAVDPSSLPGSRLPLGICAGPFGLLGIGLLAQGGRSLFTGAPRLRATSTGVWLGGGFVIPWSAVENVFESERTRRPKGLLFLAVRRETFISLKLRRRATLLRAPITCWFAAPSSIGDIDVATDATNARLLAARLEATRNRAARATA